MAQAPTSPIAYRPEIARRPGEPVTTPTAPVAETQQGSKLIVGRDIRLKGEIASCDTLVVEGQIEASMDARLIQISESGQFVGDASVDTAEIRGTFKGKLTVRDRLSLLSTGRISGTLRYGQIEIERGGEISGDIQTISGATPSAGKTREAAAIPPKVTPDNKLV